jgi:predicted DNA-binding transcriptional regulator AlpA
MQEAPRFLRCDDVMRATGLARSTLYWLARKGEFPKPVRIAAHVGLA